jgi:hypothetical protein
MDTLNGFTAPMDALNGFTVPGRDGYTTAISLNNYAITMIEKGCYSQARDTLMDSIIAMKESFQTRLQGQLCLSVVSTAAAGGDGVSPQIAPDSRSFLDLMLRRASHRIQFPAKLVNADVMHQLMLIRSLDYGYNLTPVLSQLSETPSLTCFHPIRIDPVIGDWQCGCRQHQHQRHFLCGAWPSSPFSIERECHSAIVLYNFGLANLLLSKVTEVASAPARQLKCALAVLQIASVVVGRVEAETHASGDDAVDPAKAYDLLQLAALILHATIQVHVDSSDDDRAASVYECYEYVRGALYESSRGRDNDPRWWHLFLTRAPAPAA